MTLIDLQMVGDTQKFLVSHLAAIWYALRYWS
jgi:hypothetical protein